MTRHLTELEAFSRDQLSEWIERARALRDLPRTEREKICAGREVVHLFLEPSTRTRVSFEIAARRLGAQVIDFDTEASSLKKGETLFDTVATIEAMGTDALVVRHGENHAPTELAQRTRGAVINAGDGTRAHPSQGLLDLLTLLDEFGDLDGRKIAIVGDVKHSRVAGSDVVAFSRLGAEVVLVSPPELTRESIPDGVSRSEELDPLLETLDAIVMLRIQRERLSANLDLDTDDFVQRYQLTEERLARIPAHGVVLHPGPMNRGVEITDTVADGARSRILDQVGHGVSARMAILEWSLGSR